MSNLSIKRTGEQISIKNIKDFETSLNIKLPKQFISFLLKYNGGIPSNGCFNTLDQEWGAEIRVLLKLDKLFFEPEILPEDLLIIGLTTGENYIGLSTGEDNKGKIFLTKFENYPPDKLDYGDENLLLIANTFDKFIKNLYEYPYLGYKNKRSIRNKIRKAQIEFKECSKPITLEELQKVEERSGFCLPEDYKRFILKFNGGIPDAQFFSCVGWGGGSISKFYPITPDDQLYLSDYIDCIPRGLLCIGEEEGGNNIHIAVIGKNKGKVYYQHHEVGSDDVEPSFRDVFLIAKNFDDFLNELDYSEDELEFERLMKNGKIEEAKKVLEEGLDPNTKDGIGIPLIRHALSYNHLDIMKILLDKGANTSGILHWAASANKFKVDAMKLLIQYGADVNEYLEELPGGTPLTRCIPFGRVDAVKFLIENGANVNLKVKSTGFTPLKCALGWIERNSFSYASKEKYEEIVKILKEAGANE